MKFLASFFILVIVSAISYFTFLTPHVSDLVYSMRAPMSGDKICMNKHFYPLSERVESLSGQVALFYDYQNLQSREVESAYFRINDQLTFNHYKRYPAVYDIDFDKSAIWGEALTQTKLANKAPDMILKSYDVFLNKGDESRESFNNEFSKLKVDPDLFYRIVSENDFSEPLVDHMRQMYALSPKMVPFVVVKGQYLVYPASFKDIRNGWMVINHLYNKSDEIINAGCSL